MTTIEYIEVDWCDFSTPARRQLMSGQIKARGTIRQDDGLSVPFEVPLTDEERAEMKALIDRIAARVEKRITIHEPVGA